MAVTDLKVSFRERGTTNFETDGYRLLPLTKPEYVIGLMGPDGKLNADLIPAWLYSSRQPVGIADLVTEPQGGTDIDSIFKDVLGFNMSIPPLASAGAQGVFVEITTAGELTNESIYASQYEIVGGGNAGDNTFPMLLETGDYIVLVKIDEVTPKYSFAIVDNTYGDATTVNKGIVKLYDGVDSSSTVLVPTAGALKSAYDLAYTKEPAIGAKGTAFNKDFGTAAGTVSEGNHQHTTFDHSQADLVGAVVISNISV